MMNRIYLYLSFFLLPLLINAQKVVSIKIDGSINPASASFIENAINTASQEKAACIIIHLNTPGGLLKSTRVIVTDILEASVPVVVYVSPGGAHAGSAGVFITMAAHVAAMAPSTNIGASHPVNLQGSSDPTMVEKSTNDAAAFIRTIAQKRKRNLVWAEDAVRKSVSITEAEALKEKVVDIIALNEQDLLKQIDGRSVELNNTTKIIHTSNAQVQTIEMTSSEKFLDTISDPNIAYILMMLGFYGMIFELFSPGAILPGIVGFICLILAFYSMHTLPVNYAGLALIVFGIVLFILEIKITSHGALAIGGVISLGLGSMMLIRTGPGLDFLKISESVIISTTLVSALFFFFLIALALKAQRARPVTGIEAIIGQTGEALAMLAPTGLVRIHGELWKAEAVAGSINEGQKIRVTAIKNLTLFVEQANNNMQVS